MKMFTLICVLLSSRILASGCPLEAGEVESCDNETGIVTSALQGLTISETYYYSRKGTFFTPLANHATRKLVKYDDAQGNVTDLVFEDWIYTEVAATSSEPAKVNVSKIICNYSAFFFRCEAF